MSSNSFISGNMEISSNDSGSFTLIIDAGVDHSVATVSLDTLRSIIEWAEAENFYSGDQWSKETWKMQQPK